jgi:arsenite methyltransferase
MSGRLFYQNGFFHRLVGARGTTSAFPSISDRTQDATGNTPLSLSSPQNGHLFVSNNNKPSNFGQLFQDAAAAKEIARHRVVFFGEIHSRPPIVSFQRTVQEAMATSISNDQGNQTRAEKGTLHVVFEHFSFEMQGLLDQYQQGNINFDELVTQYNEIGTENHDLEPYRRLLEDARSLNNSDASGMRQVKLHAGFLARTFARQLMKEGEQVALQSAASWLPTNPQLKGTEQHYNIFESLLTGRFIGSEQLPKDTFRGIFQAQLLKDVAMACKVNTLLEEEPQQDDKILVLVGNGHVLGYSGVPERVLERHPELAAETCVIVSHHGTDLDLDKNNDESRLKQSIVHHLNHTWGPANLADYVYIYREQEKQIYQQQQELPTAVTVKEETKSAYDKIGETAHVPGNAKKAMAIMKAMAYTDKQITIAGDDVHNFQGVGNPHIHANIQTGETVLDVGSGLGIDSFLARAAVGDTGFVLGIDISNSEVSHTRLCADRRGLSQIRFSVADMEQIPLPDQSVDVVISNGAFCLAPDKEKAFREVYRVLKPGGRISICTTTTRDNNKLEPGVSWPLCMQMFIPIKDIKPMCERIGYVDVLVDDSDSSMSMELPLEVMLTDENKNPNRSEPQRNKVHVGSAEFSHLEEYDMDAICARVCVVAKKPHDAPRL